MKKKTDQLEEKLAALEDGADLESSMDELDTDQAELLRLASALKAFQPPPRDEEKVASQLEAVINDTEPKQTAGNISTSKLRPDRDNQSRRFAPLFAAVGLFSILIACLAFIGLGVGITRGVSHFVNRLDEREAIVQEINGILEMQEKDGSWKSIENGAQVRSGAHLRTRYLSSAKLQLDDDSVIHLGPNSEIILEQMDWSLRGVRVVRVTQWSGMTEHQVTPSKRTGSLYEIRTPTATTTAVGTVFTIQVDLQQGTLVEVIEGKANVTGIGVTIPVSSGFATMVSLNQPPTGAALSLHGEGMLRGKPGTWKLAGQPVVLDQESLITGDLQAGDLIAFAGRQLTDGTLQVDHLDKLVENHGREFKLSGPLEARAQNAIVAAETVIDVTEATLLSGNDIYENMTVEGAIRSDGTWLATRVYAQEAEQPFQFTGIVQSIDDEQWVVSGVEVQIEEETYIPTEIAVGDLVQVQGWIQDNGEWLASSILPILPDVAYFDFNGNVESIDLWVISGISLETRAWTAIDPGIKPGDEVRVRGPILEDGTWVAASIESVASQPEEITLEFVGTVNSIEPWVITGIVLVIDESTEINGDVEVGSLVSVHATRDGDGNWHADQITLVDPDQAGCVTYAAVVAAMEEDLITLQDGTTIDLSDVEQVEGEIEVDSTILIVKCLENDGSVHYPLIKVLSSPTIEPTATPTPTETETPTSIILPNCFQITFLGFTDNGDGTSTWRYSAKELSCAQDLGDWVLKLPFCAQVVDAAPSPWEEVHPDPNIQLNGIKWHIGAGFDSGEFSVVLSGELTHGSTQVGAKGPDVAIGTISGPVCTAATPTPTITGTPTVTPTPTIPGIPPAVSGLVVITENDQTLTINCSGAAVEVRGNANHITLLGSCTSLTIKGNANWISAQSAIPFIEDTGNGNTILQGSTD